jgi:hypothetical protein
MENRSGGAVSVRLFDVRLAIAAGVGVKAGCAG